MKTRTVLYAEEGMVLTNGVVYGKQIFAAEGMDISGFYEITEEAYKGLLEEQIENQPVNGIL